MLLDSPYWVAQCHPEGISAIDIHPNGRRLVSCGTDPQIKVWNLLPILDPAAEADPNVPRLLATLSEHQGSVMAAAFNHSGHLLASGGNDNAVLLYKLFNTPATAKMGTTFVNLENWRAVGSIRQHRLDVTGLAWSPNDKQLATCGMDGRILVHSIDPDGSTTSTHAIPAQHNGWVKGLAFDPLGRYLASMGRNGIKVWDAQCGWALATHQQAPFERSPETTFRLRISWSPDGEHLLAVNAISGGKPTTALFVRQSWQPTFLVGHRASVVAAVANPRMFYAPRKLLAARHKLAAKMQRQAEGQVEDGSEDAAGAAEAAGDGAGVSGFDDTPSMVMACGSNDKSLTVWLSELSMPLLHLTQLHGGPVVDFAWTPDGYTLIAASSDDSISVLRFSEADLGKALTDSQLKEVLQNTFGEAAAAAADDTGGSSVPVDTQLALLAANSAAAAPPGAPAAAAAAATGALANGLPLAVQTAAAAAAQAPRQLAPQPVGSVGGATPRSGTGALERRIMPTGIGVTTGSLQPPAAAPPGTDAAGRKRAHPSTAEAPGSGPAAGPSSKRPALGAPSGAAAGQQQQQQLVARQKPAGRMGAVRGWLLECPAPTSTMSLQLGIALLDMEGPEQQWHKQELPVVLTVDNHSRSSTPAGVPIADVKLQVGSMPGEQIWLDKVKGEVLAIAGTVMFAAAATSSGLLHVWRSGGNMLLPPLVLGSPPVRMEAQGNWGLQVLGADGHLLLLDLQRCVRLLEPPPGASIAPLLAVAPAGTTVADTWVTGFSSREQQHAVQHTHVAVLSDASAWLFHLEAGCWLSLQPGRADLAGQAPHPGLGGIALAGDAERLRRGVSEAVRRSGCPARPPLPAECDAVWKRKEAELALWRSTLLGDAEGYKRWLALLANLLAQHKDVKRFKELAQDLLGPARWSPALGSYPWCPTILGLDKRELLDSLVVHAAASHGLAMALEIKKALDAAREWTRVQSQPPGAAAAAAAAGAPGFTMLPSAPMGGIRLQPPLPTQQQQQQLLLQQHPGVAQQPVQPPLLQQQQQQQAAAEAAAGSTPAPAAGSGTGGGPRRINPQVVHAHHQQQGRVADGTAAADGSLAGREPLRENRAQQQQQQQMPNGQHQLGQQQLEKFVVRPSGTIVEAADGNGAS